jgi:hypothetical protein
MAYPLSRVEDRLLFKNAGKGSDRNHILLFFVSVVINLRASKATSCMEVAIY